MLERDHFFQCSLEKVVVCKPKEFFFKPMGLLDLVI
jgi:hypothetical protein